MDNEYAKKSGRLHSILKELGARFIQTHMREPGVLITATRCRLGKRLQKATVLVSVFPEEREQEIIGKLHRKRGAFAEFVKSESRLRTIPQLDFDLDPDEKQRRSEGLL